MRAIVVERPGPPDVLGSAERPDPEPGPGQVLVDVEYANVTFVDTQLRAGTAPFPGPDPPYVPGNGVGGLVAAVGDAVDPAWLGRRVVASTGGTGGYAERAAVASAALVAIPADVPTGAAVALLADGRTAIALLRAAALVPGETVLVEAAAGGVGSLLLQLCLAAGARVVAAAGGTRKREAIAHAHVAIDYAEPGWASRVPGGVDVVFDGVGGTVAAEAFTLLRPGGRMLCFGMASGRFAPVSDDAASARAVRVVRGVPVAAEQARELTRSALAAARDGTLTPVIGQIVPLDRAAEAHAAIEARATIGKTLLAVSQHEPMIAEIGT